MNSSSARIFSWLNKGLVGVLIMGSWIISACADVKILYHNTTAYYNAYFLAKGYVREVEEFIIDEENKDYERVSPVFAPFDTTFLSPQKETIQACIEKTSLSIYRHPQSVWVDDAYFLLGKGRLFKGEYDQALTTFRYVNVSGKDDNLRVKALMEIARTFLQKNDDTSAENVMDYIRRKETLGTRENIKNFLLTEAYLLQRAGDHQGMVQKLSECLPTLRRQKEKLRIYYILAQLHEQLGHDEKSHKFYKKLIRLSPPYDILIRARLNILHNKPVSDEKSREKIRKKYLQELNERKNEDQKHIVYYSWGNFEYKHDSLDIAVEKYLLSLEQNPKEDTYQRKTTLWKLIRIYYHDKRDFITSSFYYDSLFLLSKKTDPDYEDLLRTKNNLDEYASYYTTWKEQDSLFQITLMSPEAIDSLLQAKWEEKKKAWEIARAEQTQKKENIFRRRAEEGIIPQKRKLLRGTENTGTWYFYSPEAVSRGYERFYQQWGKRPLVDYWRWKSRISRLPSERPLDKTELDSLSQATDSLDISTEPIKLAVDSVFTLSKEDLRKELPSRQKDAVGRRSRLTESLLGMGRCAQLQLNEKWEAQRILKELLREHPGSRHELRALYLLYRNDTLSIEERNDYKALMLKNYPDSTLTKVMLNPLYLEVKELRRQKLMRTYRDAYYLYKESLFDSADLILNKALIRYGGNDFVENAKLLSCMISEHTQPAYAYPLNLNSFLNTYPESGKQVYAQNLLKSAEEEQLKAVISSKPKYPPKERKGKQAIALLYFYEKEEKAIEELYPLWKSYQHPNGRVGNIVLSKKRRLLIIDGFPNIPSVRESYSLLKTEPKLKEFLKESKSAKYFFVSEKHLETLYLFRDRKIYPSYFRKKIL
ncbi:MAG: hypothetical protein OXB93_02470 [Cytophagales bacterium]|nr:hypothetical protein [Cytophagales bacterium]